MYLIINSGCEEEHDRSDQPEADVKDCCKNPYQYRIDPQVTKLS